MIFCLFFGILFFFIGYAVKLCLRTPFRSFSDSEFSQNRLFSGLVKFANVEKCEDIKKCSGFFDSLSVLIGSDTNKALEEIFDIIIDRYVIYWYKTLSTDPGFLIQVRMYLQFMSAALIHRVKCINLSEFSVRKLIPAILSHVEHLLEVMSKTKTVDSLLEETVLRGLGSHLHICMASRSAELAYLRALIHRLLPLVSLPPALLTLNKIQSEQTLLGLPNSSPFTRRQRPGSPRTLRSSARWAAKSGGFDNFASHRSASFGPAFSRQPPWIKLDANRGAYSFLIEILSTCVLLPAMDAVANPDFINKFILSGLGETTDSNLVNSGQSTPVPVLNTYVQEWTEWMAQKPRSNVRLENLLQQQEDLYPFTQFMKSIRSIEPLTAVLLMNDIDRRVRYEPLTSDSCRELRAQIWHVLALLRGSTRTAVEEDSTKQEAVGENDEVAIDSDSQLTTPDIQDSPNGMRLLNVPTEFDQLLIDVLKKPDPVALSRLVRTSCWKDVYRAASETIEKRYVPMYVESPEYLSHVLGISYRVVGPCPGSPTSPLNPRRGDAMGAQMNAGSGLFGNPLKNMFGGGGHTVEGRLVQELASSSARPQARLATRSNTKLANRAANLRDRIAEASSGSSVDQPASAPLGSMLSLDPQHQLHSHYLLSSHQVDMSDWNVYIPGLSRPEVQPGRRLIDQLMANTTGPTTRGSQDSGSFRMRLFDEPTASNSANANRTTQLSPQFMFTVRTERVVDGVRHQIARVDRKYSEFYVLEQKLLEFHGNAINKQLPRRQYTPRTFEFMESKREEFEEYLQFLLSQPFLRNSELLFTFITSKIPFSTSLLFDLNLGKLVKSVPLKLTKEKGQYLDDFLVSFYVSCSPQPIVLEPVDPRPRPNSTVITVLPSSGVGTLGGIDSLASPDHYSINSDQAPDAPSVRRRASLSIASAKNSSKQSTVVVPNAAATPASSFIARPAKCTMLDNRLRARAYWNNAGWSLDRRKELVARLCESRVITWKGLIEPLIYLLRSLSEPKSLKALPTSLPVSEPQLQECTTDNSKNKTESGALYDHVPSHDPWDVSHVAWSEAFLNGPVLPDQLVTLGDPGRTKPEMKLNLSETKPMKVMNHTQHQTGTNSNLKKSLTNNSRQISITWVDLFTALIQASRLVRQHFTLQIRYFVLWASFQLWYYLHLPIDQWLIGYLVRYLRTCLTDGYLAHALRLLKTALFFPDTPSTDVEKSQRKEQALSAIQRTILNLRFTYICNQELVEQRLSRVFHCFQQPKWNKQLSYVLLDHLVTSLFPELAMTSADSIREMETTAAT